MQLFFNHMRTSVIHTYIIDVCFENITFQKFIVFRGLPYPPYSWQTSTTGYRIGCRVWGTYTIFFVRFFLSNIVIYNNTQTIVGLLCNLYFVCIFFLLSWHILWPSIVFVRHSYLLHVFVVCITQCKINCLKKV